MDVVHAVAYAYYMRWYVQTRDIILAYILVAVTYIYVGVVFYITFPFNKGCIADVSDGQLPVLALPLFHLILSA